uniref:Uncharacterized protein n=1 Tax=Arundo donax TaxID=35708 RepID=A0A0A9CJB4_ARUDO
MMPTTNMSTVAGIMGLPLREQKKTTEAEKSSKRRPMRCRSHNSLSSRE